MAGAGEDSGAAGAAPDGAETTRKPVRVGSATQAALESAATAKKHDDAVHEMVELIAKIIVQGRCVVTVRDTPPEVHLRSGGWHATRMVFADAGLTDGATVAGLSIDTMTRMCDGCKKKGIEDGVVHCCQTCNSTFDLCPACFASDHGHPADHVFKTEDE